MNRDEHTPDEIQETVYRTKWLLDKQFNMQKTNRILYKPQAEELAEKMSILNEYDSVMLYDLVVECIAKSLDY